MVDKPIPPDSDDQDSWENLAKDLFGVEFDAPPVPSDDLDDELLNDDFLRDDDEDALEPEPETSPAEQAEAGIEVTESIASVEESATVQFVEEEGTESEKAQKQVKVREVDLDVLLDFSQPLDEDGESDSAVPTESESPAPRGGGSLFEKLAAETEDVETAEFESEEPDEFEEIEPEFDEEYDVELVDESDEDVEELNVEDDDQLVTDDFWDALEKFAPEELGTPHVDRVQTRGSKPPRDPEIGLVSGSPSNELKGNSAFETEFASDADFGLGILEDVETDDDDDDADDSELVSRRDRSEGENDRDEEKPKRRRRRRRRGGRRKKPVAEAESASEGDSEDEDREEESVVSRSVAKQVEPVDDEDLSDDLSQEETGDNEDDDDARSAGSSRYKNIPTWSEAIDLIADRKARSSSESRGSRGTRSDTKNRKRGGRRRRPRKSSS